MSEFEGPDFESEMYSFDPLDFKPFVGMRTHVGGLLGNTLLRGQAIFAEVSEGGELIFQYEDSGSIIDRETIRMAHRIAGSAFAEGEKVEMLISTIFLHQELTHDWAFDMVESPTELGWA